MSGAVSRLPLETTGFAPSTRRKSVRSTSGIGKASGAPKSRQLDTIFGSWSTLVAEKRQRVPRARRKTGSSRPAAKSWAFGLPR